LWDEGGCLVVFDEVVEVLFVFEDVVYRVVVGAVGNVVDCVE